MPGNLAIALSYIIDAISTIVLLVLLLRLVLPFLRADFRNPIAQGVLKLTSPLVIPVRRIVPSIGRLDTATLLIAYAIQLFAIWLKGLMIGTVSLSPFTLYFALLSLVVLTIELFFYAIVISIIISWIAPDRFSPLASIVNTIAEPVLRPFRRVIPPIGGFDISPVFAIIALKALSIVVSGINPF